MTRSVLRSPLVDRFGGRLAVIAAASAVLLLAAAAVSAATPGAGPAGSGADPAGRLAARWVGSWAASPVAGTASATCPGGPAGVSGQTVRNIVFASVGGEAVRVRLTNAFGTAALSVGAASVAVAGSGARTAPGTMRVLRFGGQPRITIPPGAEALSDPVRLRVPALADLAVSVFVPTLSGPATVHPVAVQDNFLSGPGNAVTSQDPAVFGTTVSCWMFLDGVDVTNPAVPGSIVAFGDSITDGLRSTTGANRRWPNDLARRLDSRPGGLSVLDQGISGNRILADGAGVSALARLDRDVLSQTGARTVIVLEGINDIGFADLGLSPPVTAADLIAGYQQIITWSHNSGLRVLGGTLTPFKGVPNYWNPTGEQIREQVNQWIRTSNAFDAVIDFAAATADPGDPQTLNPAYDSGDHLHPNDAGYQAMAEAINPRALLPRH